MSILRPIHIPVRRPAVYPLLASDPDTELTYLYLLGADGALTPIDPPAHTGTVVSIDQTGDEILLEAYDIAVVAETDSTVTLEFGD